MLFAQGGAISRLPIRFAPLCRARARALRDTLTTVLSLNPLAYSTFLRNRRFTHGLINSSFLIEEKEEDNNKGINKQKFFSFVKILDLIELEYKLEFCFLEN